MILGHAKRRNERGAAMLMVLIALALTTVLAVAFLASQGPTNAVATNIDNKAKARQVAESALNMAIDYVNEDATWRTDKTSGTWMSGASLDGGTFTLYGTDEDDGDLADDATEPVTLSVVATYNGVTHRVSAIVTPGGDDSPGNRLMFVVGSDSSPASHDQAKQTLFESWGYTVTLIDDSDSQATYDAAVAVSDVVYISETVSSGSVNTKLRDTTLGVVCDEGYLADDLGLTSSNVSTDTSQWGINIIDNTHEITSDWSTGNLVLHNSMTNLRYVTSTIASGVDQLSYRGGSSSGVTLMAADTGASLHYGAAAGRRVIFPVDDGYNFNNLNSDGLTLVRNMIEWAAGGSSSTPAGEIPVLLALYDFEPVTIEPTLAGRWPLDEQPDSIGGVSAGDDIDFKDYAIIDSYDSSLGTYASQTPTSNASVTLNSTGSDAFHMEDSAEVRGDGYIGAGGNPSSVYDLDGSSNITGSELVLSTNINIPTLSAPSGMPSDEGNFSRSSGNVNISSDRTFSNFTLSGTATITINGDVTIWVQNDFDMYGSSEIIVPDGSSLTLYTADDVDIEDNAVLNGDTTGAARVTIYAYGEKHVDLKNNAVMCAIVYTNDDFHIKNTSHFYGIVLADEEVKVEDSAQIHQDLALGGFAVGGGATPSSTADTSDLNNDGLVRGDPVAGVTGQHGTAFEFDGNDDYVEVPHDDSYLMQGGTFSVWFNADSTSGRQGLFSKDSNGYDTGGHFSVFLINRQVEVRMQSTTASYYVRTSSSAITAGQWYHIMFAWGEEGMVLYLNGVEVDTDPYTGGLGTTSGGIGNYEPIVLGGNAWQSGDLVATPVKDHFDGTLDDLRIYNERLSESQALEIYNGAIEPSPFISEVIVEDTSGYGDPLDLAVDDPDDVTWDAGGLRFDSSTYAISLTEATKLYDAINATGEFSVELTLLRAVPGTTSSPSQIIAMGEGTTDTNFVFGQDGASYEARVRDSSTGSSGALSPDFVSTTQFVAAIETHVVLSYVDGEVSVFIDGQLDETNTAGGVLNNWEDDHYLVFGSAFGGGSAWQGTLQRVAIYDRGFNQSQANNVYNGLDPGDGGSSGGTGSGSAVWDEVD